MMILFGISLLSYNYIPNKYERERDFAIWFLGILFLILIAPSLLYKILFEDVSYESASGIVYFLLTRPLSSILNLFGINSTANGIDLTFWMQNGKRESCGIQMDYSFYWCRIVFYSSCILNINIGTDHITGEFCTTCIPERNLPWPGSLHQVQPDHPVFIKNQYHFTVELDSQ